MITFEFPDRTGVGLPPDPSPGPWRVQVDGEGFVNIRDAKTGLVADLGRLDKFPAAMTNARVIVGALQRLEEVEVFLCLLKSEGGAHHLELDEWLDDLVGDIEEGGE